jgi:hypothetical protein
MPPSTDALPGGDLIENGLADHARGVCSIEALLVSIGAPRLAPSASMSSIRFPAPSVGCMHNCTLKTLTRRTQGTTDSFAASSASSGPRHA